jgi:hypothetical protein
MPFWAQTLQYLRPDQLNVLAYLADHGEQVEEDRRLSEKKSGISATVGPGSFTTSSACTRRK